MESIYTPEYRRFLVRLRQARQDAGLDQRAAGKRLGKTQFYVSRCETGARRVDIGELVRFAKAYDKPVAFFFK
jgi:transcriptional regulator with XRE-family HTH domain